MREPSTVAKFMLIALVLSIVGVVILANYAGKFEVRRQAIEAGVAEWKFETNPKTGSVKTTFVFKSPIESP